MRVSSRAAKRAYQRERSPWRDGGNPRNENGMAGKPETERIAATADGPGDRLDAVAGRGNRRREEAARIGDARRARVGDEGERLARREPLEDLGDPAELVVLVAGDARRRDAVPREEVAGAAGVLAEDEARVAKGREGPGGEVFEVADGGGDDEEAPGGAGGGGHSRMLPAGTGGQRRRALGPPRAGRASYDRVDEDPRRRPFPRSRVGRGRRRGVRRRRRPARR